MTDVKSFVTITVNGRNLEAPTGELLIEAAERAGHYIPRFCYHPRMEPVGMCRMCLVEVDGPRGTTLQPACFIKVGDGMNVVTDSEKVKKAQDGVLEFLLANHPLDCPVCDKGGECPLQDQALAHGSGEARYIEEKRHFVKPIEIGELVLLDRERCIQCARCTRFSAEVAGDTEIAFAGRGDKIEVAPSPNEPFDSIFSGNTVQICPVGALTAKPYRFSARPWDLEQVESTCTTCSVGCRVAVQSSGNRLTRLLGVDSEPVNHGWLCDKGRFTFDAVDGHEESTDLLSAATRVRDPLVRTNGVLTPTSWGEALARAARILKDAAASGSVGAIGGAALTNEGAFAWERFVRGVLKSDHLDAQYGDGLDGALLQALPRATIDEAAHARVVVTLTGDLREELPVLFLRLRENFVKRGHALVEFAFGESALHSLATVSMSVRPGEAHVVAAALTSADGRVPRESLVTEDDLRETRRLLGETGEGVVIIVGRANVAEDPRVMERAIRLLADRFPEATFLPALRRSNVMGALDMGLGPQLLPGRGYLEHAAGHGRRQQLDAILGSAPRVVEDVTDATVVPVLPTAHGIEQLGDEEPGDVGSARGRDRTGRDTLAQLEAMREGAQTAVLLLGGCLLGNVLDVPGAVAALERVGVVVVTGHGGRTLAYADVVLPASVQHERRGTVTNIEGRVTAVNAKIVAPGSAWSDVAIAAELADACDEGLGFDSIEHAARIIEEATGYPALSVLNDAADEGTLAGRFDDRVARRPLDPMAFPGIRAIATLGLGELAGATDEETVTTTHARVSATLGEVTAGGALELANLDSYAFALTVSRRLYDHGVAMQGSPALANLVARANASLNHFDLDRLGLRTGDVVDVTGVNGTVALPVTLNDETPRGTIGVVFSAIDDDGDDTVVRSLFDPSSPITQVRLETR